MDEKVGINFCAHCMEKMNAEETVCSKCGHVSGEENTPVYALTPGTVLNGKYLVGMVMGQGGFGITYIGLDLILQKKVAIKEYFPQNFSSRNGTTIMTWFDNKNHDTGCENFLKEARNMAKLSNLNSVVTVHDLFYENNTAYIIMDFIEGETLKNKVMREGPMTFEECMKLLKPIMEGLEQVHEKGFVHRDIKPDNIMIQPDGKAMLLDLGAAKNLEAQNQNSSVVSGLVVSHGFSPLEQYTDAGNVGAWSDVYALTATIIYAVTGKLPQKALDRINEKNPIIDDPESKIPLNKVAAIKKGIALMWKDRYQTVKELSAALEPPYKFKSKPPRTGFIEFLKRKKKLFIVLGIVLVILIILFFAIGLYPGKKMASGKCGNDAYWEVRDAFGVYTLTISGTGAIDGYEYKKEKNDNGDVKEYTTAPWFKYSESIEQLEIKEGITEIGERNFEFLNCLDYVILPDSLKSIGFYSFDSTALEKIDLPSSVETICWNAFAECQSLEEFTIPANVTEVQGNPFWECDALVKIDVEIGNDSYISKDGVLYTKDGETLVAYPSGKSETDFTVPDGVKTIDYAAFDGNDYLETITLPNELKKILKYSFESCNGLKSITIPASVESIGAEAFGYEKDYFKVTFMGAPEMDNTDDEGTFLNTKAIVTLHTENDDDLWKLWDSGDKFLNYGGTLTWVFNQTEAAESDTGADNLFDGDAKTKWEVDFKNQKTTDGYVYVYFKTSEFIDLSKKSLHYKTGADNSQYPGRNPKDFALADWTDKNGYTDCVTFSETDARDENEKDYYINISKDEKAQYFRLYISSTQGSDYMQFSELYFDDKE